MPSPHPPSVPGPPDLRPVLTILPGAGHRGMLRLPLEDGDRVDVQLPSAGVLLLLALADAALEDGEADPMRGYRDAETIGKLYNRRRGAATALSSEAVVHYIWKTRRRIRDAVEHYRQRSGSSAPVPVLIEQFTSVGYRLSRLGLEVRLR